MRRLVKALLVAMAVFFTAVATGCGADDPGNGSPDAVAATVNGTPILEGQVTDRIQMMRQLNGYEEAAKWREMLEGSGSTPELYREQIIMAMVQDIVIRQAAAAEGLVLDSANVEVQISQARAEAGEEGNAWAERLRQWGLSSEDEYRDRLEVRDLAAQLRNLKTPPVAPAEDELRAYVEANAARYAGRRSSRILLLRTVGMSEEDLLAHALNIRDQLRWGADLGTVAAEYTRTTNGSTMNGDMGWDAMNSSSPEYQAALNGLWPGEVSEPVVSEAGVTIIKCTDIYVLPEDGMVVYEWVPEGLRQMLSDQMAVQMQENSYRSYIDGLIRNAVVVIEPMPAGLPYAE